MFRRKLFLLFSIFSVLLLFSYPALAITFTDDFDDESFTNSNWSVFLYDWEYNDNGYHGSAGPVGSNPGHIGEREPAIALADNQRNYLSDGLMIQTLFTIDEDSTSNFRHTGEVFFSFNDNDGSIALGSAGLVYNEQSTEDEIFQFHLNGGGDTFKFSLHDLGIDTEEEFINTLFGLDIYIGKDWITASLYNGSFDTNNLIGSWSTESLLQASGMVGLATNSEATFEYFSVSGNTAPVPEPSTVILLGTGLLGLAGASRRKFLKK